MSVDHVDLVINFTPTGMVPTRVMTPYVPITPSEIIEDVRQAYEVGITSVHIHARDETTGEPTYKAETYREIIEGIRDFAPDLVICVSLSGRNWSEFEKRIEPLTLEGKAKPDMGSLTLSSLNFPKQASVNSPETIVALAGEMASRNIKPELEAFDTGMINFARYLAKKELIKPPFYFNLIFGNIANAQADFLHAGLMVRELPGDSLWSMGGIGDSQLCMNSIAIAMGGGVRVGLEDNIWYDKDRTVLARNVDLIKRIHTLAAANGRKVMLPSELRKRLRLRDGFSGYGCEA